MARMTMLAAAALALAAGPAAADGVPECVRVPGTQAQIIHVPEGGCTGSGIILRRPQEWAPPPAASVPRANVAIVVIDRDGGGVVSSGGDAPGRHGRHHWHRDRPTVSPGYAPGLSESGAALGGPPHRHRPH